MLDDIVTVFILGLTELKGLTITDAYDIVGKCRAFMQ